MKKSVIFILLLIILSVTGVIAYIFAEGGKNKTIFTVKDLAKLADNGTIDYVAGEAIRKGFKKFDPIPGITVDKNKYSLYNYYFVGDYKNSFGGADEHQCQEFMIERITISDTAKNFIYTIKDREKYNSIIEDLEDDNTGEVPESSRLTGFENNRYYVIGNCAFIEVGYKIDYNGYSVIVSTLPNLAGLAIRKQADTVSLHNESKKAQEPEISQKKDTVESKKELFIPADRKAYISVNRAEIYKRYSFADFYTEHYPVEKGTELNIIKTEKDYYYCDFLLNKVPSTGWFHKDDITFIKPVPIVRELTPIEIHNASLKKRIDSMADHK